MYGRLRNDLQALGNRCKTNWRLLASNCLKINLNQYVGQRVLSKYAKLAVETMLYLLLVLMNVEFPKNNCLSGGPQFIETDLRTACAQVVAETGDAASNHASDDGWYSHSVLARVLDNTVPPRWRLRLAPMRETELPDFCKNPSICGALVNEGGIHWTAIVKHAHALWHVDSCLSPYELELSDLRTFFHRHPAMHLLLETEDIA